MRIACIGNMNNIIAPTAQYLAEMGHSVDLFLLYEYDHFNPESEYDDPKEIKFSVKKIEMNFGDVMKISKADLKELLSNYDFYIGTDYAPAILSRINRRLDIFAWAGTDLLEWPFYQSKYVFPRIWEIEKIQTAFFQKIGIKNSRFIPMSINNDYILDTIKKINISGTIINPLPFLYYPQLKRNQTKENANFLDIQDLKSNNDLVIVQQTRQWWYSAPKSISKGNDVFLRGIKKFKEIQPEIKFKVILFEYGADVDKSKELISSLGLAENVVWMPKMLRKQLLKVLDLADIGVGQFGEESWFLYCSNAEILATKTVFLGFRNDFFYKEHGIKLYPMLNANSDIEVCNSIVIYLENKQYYVAQSEIAFDWLLEYNEKSFLKQITQLLKNKTKTKLPILNSIKIIVFIFFTKILRVFASVFIGFRNNKLISEIAEWEK